MAGKHVHDERCEELRAALRAAKARLHSAPVASTMMDDAPGAVALGQHADAAAEADVDQIEQALHAMGCR